MSASHWCILPPLAVRRAAGYVGRCHMSVCLCCQVCRPLFRSRRTLLCKGCRRLRCHLPSDGGTTTSVGAAAALLCSGRGDVPLSRVSLPVIVTVSCPLLQQPLRNCEENSRIREVCCDADFLPYRGDVRLFIVLIKNRACNFPRP